jgi:hypothetical protein
LIIGHWLYDYFQFVTLVTQKEEALRFDNWLYPYEIIIGGILWFQLWRDRQRA